MSKNIISRRYFVVALILLISFAILTIAITMSGAGSGSVNGFDKSIENIVAPLRANHALANAMLALTDMGSPQVALVLVICLLCIIFIVRQKRIIELFIVGLVSGEVLAFLIKIIVERNRPQNFFNLAVPGYSYPSAHALFSTILFGSIIFLANHLVRSKIVKWKIVLISLLIILLVGFSRVFLGVHYVTDVLGGWILGASVVCFIAAIFTRIHIHKKDELKML